MIVHKHRTADSCINNVKMHTKMYPFKTRGTHVLSPVFCCFFFLIKVFSQRFQSWDNASRIGHLYTMCEALDLVPSNRKPKRARN